MKKWKHSFGKKKPDPLLEKVAEIITTDNPDWEGSASELVALIGIDLKANTLSLKLNVNASRLLNECNFSYSSSRSHAGRKLSFHLLRDDRVDGDDDLFIDLLSDFVSSEICTEFE